MKRKFYYFLLLLFCTIFIIINVLPQYNIIVYGDIRTTSYFPIYITQDKAFSFQLLGNISQYLTLTATNNTFNVTGNNLIMRNNEGQFSFTPNTDSTIKINHNMDYVKIKDYNDTFNDIMVNNNTYYDVYKDKSTIIIFKIKGYDISGFVTRIGIGIISICGLILAPIISTFLTKDKMELVFIVAMCWIFFGILFYTWLFMW